MKINALILDNSYHFGKCLEIELKNLGLFKEVFLFDKEKEFIEFLVLSKGKLFYIFFDYLVGQNNKTLNELYQKFSSLFTHMKIIVICSTTNPVLIKEVIKLKPRGFCIILTVITK